MQNFGDDSFRRNYRTAVGILEGRDPHTGQRMAKADGKPVSLYSVNKEDPRIPGSKKITMTRSYLRSEVLLSPSLSQYTFPILDNVPSIGSNGINPTEKRLKQQDVFFCNRLGFYIYNKSTGAGKYQYELMTFPNANFFGSTGLDLDLLTGLWTAGQLNVTINNDVLTPAWDMQQHMAVQQTEIPAISVNGSPYFNQIDYSVDGIAVVEPNWILNGANNNIFNLIYPVALSNMGIGTTQLYFVMKFEGFLAQNCSSIMDNQSKY